MEEKGPEMHKHKSSFFLALKLRIRMSFKLHTLEMSLKNVEQPRLLARLARKKFVIVWVWIFEFGLKFEAAVAMHSFSLIALLVHD